MNIVQTVQKTGTTMFRSPFTKVFFVTLAGYAASKNAEKMYDKLVAEPPTKIVVEDQK